MNVCRYLERTAALAPDRPAVLDLDAPGGRCTRRYGELWARVRRTAQGLAERGLRPGDRVALLSSNGWEYVEAFLGIACAGMVAVPLNTRLLAAELQHMLADSGARLLIAEQAQLAGRPGLTALPELGTALIRAEGPAPVGGFPFETLAEAPPAAPVPVHPDTLLSLMYTSGTTGLPKGVMLSHGSWSAVTEQTLRCLDYAAAEGTVHAAPLTHGSGFLLLPTLAVGGTNLLCARFQPRTVLDLFRREGATNGFFVPSMIRMLLDEAAAGADESFGTLRTLYYAGSPIDTPTLREALARFGPVLVQSFGQMESPMFLTVLDRADHARVAGGDAALARAAGRPVLGARVRIVDDEDRDVAPGEVGEIVALAPQTMLGYWNREDASAQTLRGGWLHTGDLGRLDAEGYLYVVDRKKDMIISGGSNVYAREVEEVLLGHPQVAEAAVIGLPHPKWGERVTAVLVAREGRGVSDEALDAYCRAHLPDYRRPRRWIWVEALPRNPYGKVLKRELRERYAEPTEPG